MQSAKQDIRLEQIRLKTKVMQAEKFRAAIE